MNKNILYKLYKWVYPKQCIHVGVAPFRGNGVLSSCEEYADLPEESPLEPQKLDLQRMWYD